MTTRKEHIVLPLDFNIFGNSSEEIFTAIIFASTSNDESIIFETLESITDEFQEMNGDQKIIEKHMEDIHSIITQNIGNIYNHLEPYKNNLSNMTDISVKHYNDNDTLITFEYEEY